MFSIIIPTHDRPQLLSRALFSLAAQTFQDFQTIIVSDSSQYVPPYDVLKVLPGTYCYLLRNGQPGPAESRNQGIRLVNRPYAIFLDDDDTFEPDHLQYLAGYLTQHPLPAGRILYHDFCVLEEDRNQFPPTFIKKTPVAIPGIVRENIYISNLIPNSCLVIPSERLGSAQFDPGLILFEDWDYLLGCLKSADLVHLPINTVSIHKSHVAGDENRRRGNTNNEQLLSTTLEIYRRHRAPNAQLRELRRQRFLAMGIDLPAEYQ